MQPSSKPSVQFTAADLTATAREVGLDLAAAVPVGATPTWDRYREWLTRGRAGEMAYLARPDAVHRRRDPRHIVPEAKTVLVVAASYAGPGAPQLPTQHGRVSRYVWGPKSENGVDYHRWLLKRLKVLIRRIESLVDRPISSRPYIDTGPVLERAWAQAAGLGWTGKNTTLIHPQLGSFTFLGVAFLDVDLPAAPPPALPSCGTCTRCIDACPTGALIAPGTLDARRCLSYLTIEHRGPISETYRAAMGTRVFGCDTCQDVCPWNRKPIETHRGEAVPDLAALRLPDLLRLDEADFRSRFRRTPIWRATPDGLARNAAIVLGNLGDPEARTCLEQAAAHHPHELVAEAAAWALARLD
jgi:epoxyqueuosine reductase